MSLGLKKLQITIPTSDLISFSNIFLLLIKNNMNQLPKDILVFMALNLDLPEILSLCQTNSEFNDRICKNNYFWLNKLDRDYGLKSDLSNAKREYSSIKDLLRIDPRKVFGKGIYTENFKLVKAAVDSGFVPHNLFEDYYLISKSLGFESDEILRYVLYNVINTGNIDHLIRKATDAITYHKDLDIRCIMFKRLYSIVLPYASEIVDNNKYRNFWKTVVMKLKENIEEECIDQNFYNKWIGFYQELSN